MKFHYFAIILLFLGVPVAGAKSKPPLGPEIVAAAEQGDAGAQFQVARACLRGEGMPMDLGKSFKLMKSAAEKGYADAVGGLGYYYITGSGVEKDGQKAFDCFRKGAELGSAKAQYNFGRCLLQEEKTEGIPRPKDSKESEKMSQEGIDWIKKAADQRLTEAAASLGRYYYFGEHGLKEDKKAASVWLILAAQAGDAESQNYLATILSLGLAGPKDDKTAEYWYKQASLQNNQKAQANLGALLSNSPKDHGRWIEGIAWLFVAQRRGEITATKTLEAWASLLDPAVLAEVKPLIEKLEVDIREKKAPM